MWDSRYYMDEYLSAAVKHLFANLNKFDRMVDEPLFEDFAADQRNRYFLLICAEALKKGFIIHYY